MGYAIWTIMNGSIPKVGRVQFQVRSGIDMSEPRPVID